MHREKEVAILLYDRMTALDAIGPYEVLARLPGVAIKFVGTERGVKRADRGLGLEANYLLTEVPAPAILLVPGGPGQADLMANQQVMEWIRNAHAGTEWTASVCTGSLLLAGAGILNGVQATSHWLALEELGRLGAIPVRRRVVFDGRIVTGAGVSAGIDLALELAGKMAGVDQAEMVQLGIEYNPQPPFNAGDPEQAKPALVEKLRLSGRFHRKGRE